jgi:hypothetical protein
MSWTNNIVVDEHGRASSKHTTSAKTTTIRFWQDPSLAAERERIINKIAMKLREYEPPPNGISSTDELLDSFEGFSQHAHKFRQVYAAADGATPKRVLSRAIALHEDNNSLTSGTPSTLESISPHKPSLHEVQPNGHVQDDCIPMSLLHPSLNWSSWDGSSSSDGSYNGRAIEEEKNFKNTDSLYQQEHHSSQIMKQPEESDDDVHPTCNYQNDVMNTSVIFSGSATSPARRPPHSYSALIEMVIRQMPDQRCTLRHIYNWIQHNFDYYRQSKKNWKNAVRHNLSVNDCFMRTTKDNKTNYWTFNPQKIDQLPSVRKRRSLLKRMAIGRTPENIRTSYGLKDPHTTASDLQAQIEPNVNNNSTSTMQQLSQEDFSSFSSMSETTSMQTISDMFSDMIGDESEISLPDPMEDETQHDPFFGVHQEDDVYLWTEGFSLDVNDAKDLSVGTLPTIPEEPINDVDWYQFLQ